MVLASGEQCRQMIKIRLTAAVYMVSCDRPGCQAAVRSSTNSLNYFPHIRLTGTIKLRIQIPFTNGRLSNYARLRAVGPDQIDDEFPKQVVDAILILNN